MNTYHYVFTAPCPNNDEIIVYTLKIESVAVIMVEKIIEVCIFEGESKMFHEEIADYLTGSLPGRQEITATHSGVRVITTR